MSAAEEAAVDMEVHERWAKHTEVQQLLQYMLDFPFLDHSEAVVAVLRGELRRAHAIGLFRESKHFKRKGKCGSGVMAYHIWLYHFLGGARAKLRPPPTTGDADALQWSATFYIEASRDEQKFAASTGSQRKARGRAIAAGDNRMAGLVRHPREALFRFTHN